MKRTGMLFVVTAVTAATLVVSAVPVLAASPTDSVVFFPLGNGATYSCTGGPPFVQNGHAPSMGNCAFEHIGPPAGLVCDVPTTIAFVHGMHQEDTDGRLCRSDADTNGFMSA